ncbi:hypothetical protein V8D89_008475 [Ganoderma adspersum]
MGPLPRYAYLSPEAKQLEAELTRDGVYDLLPSELSWQQRQPFLKSKGYTLRRRYEPGWKPSWTDTDLDPTYCEDSIVLVTDNVIDATRDGLYGKSDRVSIKLTESHAREINIARFLASIRDPHNHSIPILDVFQDPLNPQKSLFVMPYLLPFNEPEFEAVGEVVDFVFQSLEGLAFLHRQRIAHRDIAPPNVMMDGQPLFPHGHHPVRHNFSPDAVYQLSPLSRLEHPVRYFYIDFGISIRFTESAPPHALGIEGRYKEAPEMSFSIPYDAFKVDVFALGTLYFKEFLEMYYGLDFLQPLVNAMREPDSERRLDAKDAVTMLEIIRTKLTSTSLRWRLRPRTESTPERVVYDTVAVAREGLYHLKRLVA